MSEQRSFPVDTQQFSGKTKSPLQGSLQCSLGSKLEANAHVL